MKKIVYKTNNGVAIITPNPDVMNQIQSVYSSKYDDKNEAEVLAFAYEVIAQKDIPRILPPDEQELWGVGLMTLAEYLKFPIPEYKIVDDSEVLTDRTFRNAWNYDLKEDILKSREIKKGMLRVERAPLLADLDVQVVRATETGAKTDALVAEKNRLRDITLLVDAAGTIDEIKAVTCA